MLRIKDWIRRLDTDKRIFGTLVVFSFIFLTISFFLYNPTTNDLNTIENHLTSIDKLREWENTYFSPINNSHLAIRGEKKKDYISPVKNFFITSTYGTNRSYGIHEGLDLRASVGTKLFAVNNCIVHVMSTSLPGLTGYGRIMGLKCTFEDGIVEYVYYAHLSSWRSDLQVGDTVEMGEHIANSGQSGNVTGPHLHFEIRVGCDTWEGKIPIPQRKCTVDPNRRIEPNMSSITSPIATTPAPTTPVITTPIATTPAPTTPVITTPIATSTTTIPIITEIITQTITPTESISESPMATTPSASATITTAPLVADLDLNLCVDIADFVVFRHNFRASNGKEDEFKYDSTDKILGDYNKDNEVDVDDFVEFRIPFMEERKDNPCR